MHLQGPAKRRPAINVTSLIDVLFLLLTFFLVSTQFVDQSALKVELPKTAHSEKTQSVPRKLVVSADGQMQLDGQIVDRETLKTLLSDQAEEIDAGGGLSFEGDVKLSYGDYVDFMDLVRSAGIKRFLIQRSEKTGK